ncbi:hypothetical protein GW17_00041433 [Ensete ventricosum]|nr:hypothetical protein GW17_00041433 [Ensete ventricosum]
MMGQDQAWALGRGSDDAVGLRREFARRFAKGIEKLAVNTPGDCRKKTKRLTARMLEAAGLAGRFRWVNHRRAAAGPPIPWNQDGCQRLSAAEPPRIGRWLTMGKLPRTVVELLVSGFF